MLLAALLTAVPIPQTQTGWPADPPALSRTAELALRPEPGFGAAVSAGSFTAVLRADNKAGFWEVWLEAKEAKEAGGLPEDLIGRDQRFSPDRYRHKLNGTYSIVARKPDGRLKFKIDRVGGLFRSFWGFEAVIAGEPVKGWMELAPLPLPARRDFSIKPLGVVASRLKWTENPVQDRSDRRTGFRAVLRDYHWSGTDGKAWVVTFDDRMPWRAQDIKLVFPEQAAWVPGYQLSPRHLVQFEFIETWGGGAQGCYEPMSDRVDRFGKVELVEDKPDRKVLRWTYQLANPDYVRWGELAGGTQKPEVEELWTIYPDGSAVRRQRYWPSLDSGLRQHDLGCQVAEFDVVWAADTLPEEATPRQAATIFSPGRSHPIAFPSQRRPEDPQFAQEPEFGVAIHSLDEGLPDVFGVFSQAGATNPPYQLSTDGGPDWHREKFWRFSHFPFGFEPFQYETNSQTEGRGRITHSSLVYVGAPQDRDWESKYKVDDRGRKYREFVSVVGLGPRGKFDSMLGTARSSLAKASIPRR